MIKMGIINLSIDDETKNKIEKIVKQKGFKDINTFIVETIKKEIDLEVIPFPKEEKKKFLHEKEVIKQLSYFSEKLSEIKSKNEKVRILVEFDRFLKNNKEIIKDKCPNLLVSVLNSL
jgi:antitoxin component of RelBE/YafQ-DinJ toxin-antitoxin module